MSCAKPKKGPEPAGEQSRLLAAPCGPEGAARADERVLAASAGATFAVRQEAWPVTGRTGAAFRGCVSAGERGAQGSLPG